MNRSDRLLLEHHVIQLDQMQRAILEMRSVLTRRIRRLESDRIVTSRNPTTIRRERRLDVQLQVQDQRPEMELMTRTMEAETRALLREERAIQAPPPVRRTVNVIPHFKNAKIKIKYNTLKVAETNDILPDVCGVCLNNHKKVDSLACNCNHVFGKECLSQWKSTCNKSEKNVTCPTCRVPVTEIINNRPRKPRAPREPRVVAQIREPDLVNDSALSGGGSIIYSNNSASSEAEGSIVLPNPPVLNIIELD
jgi:hypothetical protein